MSKIVVFGATGYTGDLVARALVARGVRPLLAARSADRLKNLSLELGGLPTQVADVSQPESMRALVQRGDVLISTVGPFVRWGEPAVTAALAAQATYLDSTGEPSFIRKIFERHDEAAQARCALLTAFGFDWVPGNLASALALREAGPTATRIEVGYFPRNTAISRGTRSSILEAAFDGSYALQDRKLVSERAMAHVRSFDVAGKSLLAASVGGSEHFGLPRNHAALRDVGVYLGMPGAKMVSALSAVTSAITSLPGVRVAGRALAERWLQGPAGGPDAGARNRSSSAVVAEAFSATGRRLTKVQLNGPDPYSFTADFLAWAAVTALEHGVQGVGALDRL
jgi:short subunit dehydrogenase-like uncharacterized protein